MSVARRYVGAVAVYCTACVGGALAGAIDFGTPESTAGWSFSNGPEWPGAAGELKWSATEGRSAPGAAEVVFNFEKGGNYVAAIVKLPADPPVKAVRLWLKKPGGNLVTFRAADSEGQTFQKNLRYTFPGWQRIEVTLGQWAFHWGGTNDGTIRGPYRDFHILIENDGGIRTGSMFIDDVEFLTGPVEDAGSLKTATYEAATFAPDEDWKTGEGRGTLERPDWKYVLDAKKGRASLNAEFSLLARPTAMKVVVEGDGSGHGLAVVLGSHFQMFERTVGVLSDKGRMEFEARLGDLTDWKHYGGEDDGIVRLPLRVLGLAVVKKGESSSGSIRPVSIQVTTEYEPDRAIEIIPSVRPEGEQAKFSVQMRSLLDKAVDAKLHWSLHGVDKPRRNGIETVAVPAQARPARFEVTEDIGDTGVVEGRFCLELPGQKAAELTCTIAPVPKAPGSSERDTASMMGAGLYLYRFHKTPDYKEKIERMCILAQRAGVKWTREEFHWNWIETAKGKFDWSYFDCLVDTAAKHGISVYGLMCYWTEWTKPNTEQGIKDYCDYLAAAVERYKGRIKHWEIWNEPNIFFWSGTREQYVETLKRAYETIKRVDPEAQVLGCSTAGIDTAFIQFIVDKGGPMDALTVHPYRGELNAAGFIREMQDVRKLVGGKDVWITEMGWPSNIGGLTERAQAGYVARTYLSAFASGAVRSVSWYDFREDGEDPFYNEHHFGLVRNRDLTPKMGYVALTTVGNLFAGLRCTRTHAFGGDLEGFDFADGKRQVTAVWTAGPARLTSLEVGDPAVEVRNIAGERMDVAAQDGKLTFVLLSGLPVYLCGPSGFEVKSVAAPAEAKVSADAYHTGDTASIGFRAAKPIQSVRLQPCVPPLWDKLSVAPREAADEAGFRVTFTVLENVPPGTYTLTAVVQTADERQWEVPIAITVAPPVIRT